MMESRRSVLWKYFVVCEDDESKVEVYVHSFSFSPSTTIRIRVQPNTENPYSAQP